MGFRWQPAPVVVQLMPGTSHTECLIPTTVTQPPLPTRHKGGGWLPFPPVSYGPECVCALCHPCAAHSVDLRLYRLNGSTLHQKGTRMHTSSTLWGCGGWGTAGSEGSRNSLRLGPPTTTRSCCSENLCTGVNCSLFLCPRSSNAVGNWRLSTANQDLSDGKLLIADSRGLTIHRLCSGQHHAAWLSFTRERQIMELCLPF